ncbi:F0F1 ATP synthase subunit B [Robiginitalea marina]|jgi:F-type H+-transporting ATPase subunit b|uniref:ATP synthase subunit b n=1 Tax=Robiginitalea marina TaxID=2954105 RepID=A0ABT1AXB4_9FLAO|nr:F0F1 ATP synthase subunit B [Robiginitalea marina]MCO5724257.1 F0F1 ATP synthase subunit B [Robiginitalea marina]
MEKLINEFSIGLFFWQIVLFVLLLLLLRKFAWKPILRAVNEREQGIRSALAAAEDAKKEMQNVSADSERLLQQARAEREALLKEAREIKDKMIADARAQAQAEGDKIVRQAQESIEGEKKAAIADIKNQVASFSVEIAEKVLQAQLENKDRQLKLVDQLVDDIKLR